MIHPFHRILYTPNPMCPSEQGRFNPSPEHSAQIEASGISMDPSSVSSVFPLPGDPLQCPLTYTCPKLLPTTRPLEAINGALLGTGPPHCSPSPSSSEQRSALTNPPRQHRSPETTENSPLGCLQRFFSLARNDSGANGEPSPDHFAPTC